MFFFSIDPDAEEVRKAETKRGKEIVRGEKERMVE
jgi:hypothetical protein